ncbi:MAG: cytochrome-c oxidase, cbb3-type subunit III, partial [Pseudomonadota bacterium]
GAQGYTAFPNLRDDDWLWGGSVEDIHYTLKHGIRWEADPDTRFSAMPAFLTDEILSKDEISNVAHYVLSLSGAEHDAAAAAAGETPFVEQCSACHGENGKGMRELGAPNLTDAIWLYGGSHETIVKTVAYARNGVMPAWSERLDDVTVKQLAIYVALLGGGETTLAEAAKGKDERADAGDVASAP